MLATKGKGRKLIITEIFTLNFDKFDHLCMIRVAEIHFQKDVLLKIVGRENNNHHNIKP